MFAKLRRTGSTWKQQIFDGSRRGSIVSDGWKTKNPSGEKRKVKFDSMVVNRCFPRDRVNDFCNVCRFIRSASYVSVESLQTWSIGVARKCRHKATIRGGGWSRRLSWWTLFVNIHADDATGTRKPDNWGGFGLKMRISSPGISKNSTARKQVPNSISINKKWCCRSGSFIWSGWNQLSTCPPKIIFHRPRFWRETILMSSKFPYGQRFSSSFSQLSTWDEKHYDARSQLMSTRHEHSLTRLHRSHL